MILSENDRRYTLNEFLRHISHIQDKNYQIRIWIQGKGPECQGFDDAVCDFFDIGDPILKEYKEFGLSEQQCELLRKFRHEFKLFAAENDWPPDFIDTPEWTKITEMAKEVLKAFNFNNG